MFGTGHQVDRGRLGWAIQIPGVPIQGEGLVRQYDPEDYYAELCKELLKKKVTWNPLI